MRDILKFQAFLEMSSYSKELVRFKPPLRIQHFVENPAYTQDMKTKKRRLIQDWFRVVHWFVRLRRASRGRTPYSLLDLELKVQGRGIP